MKNNFHYIYLGLGSNLRTPTFNNLNKILLSVKHRLTLSGLRVVSSSKNWISYPLPYSQLPLFNNCVIKCIDVHKKFNNPYNLLESLKKLERLVGRKKKFNISRVIDIDILDFKGMVHEGKLILPHPRMHLRSFVLDPLSSINKNWTHPILKKRVDVLKSKIKTRQYLKEKL